MATEPSDHEDRVNEQTGGISERQTCATLTRDALSLLIHGVMRRARGVNGAAQLLGFLIGCRLYELDRGLQDAELQGHRHLWERQGRDEKLCHVTRISKM